MNETQSDVIVRPLASTDAAAVVGLWNRCLHKDPITEERFWRLFLLDENFDIGGTLVAAVGGQVIGFLQAMCRKVPLGSLGLQPEQGWVTVFFVDQAFQRRGVGTQLLEAGLAFLRGRGRTRVMVNGYAPYYLFPGVDEAYEAAHAFLRARGFAPGAEAVAMGMALEGVRTPDAVRERRDALTEEEGFTVRLFRREDTLALLAFTEAHFPHWTPSLRDGLRAGNEEILVATDGEGQIVAYTQWQNPHNDPPHGAAGRFGPFGVHPELRSRGLGAVVFYSLIERVTGNGARYLWFGWAGGRNLSFYERAGCKVTRRFRLYSRTL